MARDRGWASVARLQDAIIEALAQAGIVVHTGAVGGNASVDAHGRTSTTEYHPHVTLAKARTKRRLYSDAPPPGFTCKVGSTSCGSGAVGGDGMVAHDSLDLGAAQALPSTLAVDIHRQVGNGTDLGSTPVRVRARTCMLATYGLATG